MGCGSSKSQTPASNPTEKKQEESKPIGNETKPEKEEKVESPKGENQEKSKVEEVPKEEEKQEEKKEEVSNVVEVKEESEKEKENNETKNEEHEQEKKEEDREETVLITKEQAPVQHENFDHQTGGHVGAFKKVDDSKIMKKVGKNEFSFYQEVHNYPVLKDLAPSFHGIHEADELKYIIISDLTHGFSKPCILDVKIGRQSFGEDADEEKKANMEKKDKESTTYPLGVRITAMKVYNASSGDYIKKGKAEGKKVTVDGFQDALAEYFHNGVTLRKNIIPHFIERLNKVVEWAENQVDHRIYSSSVLFIYDGEEDNDKVELRLIDFAHVHKIEDGGKDDGYIFGIKNLHQYLHNIHA